MSSKPGEPPTDVGESVIGIFAVVLLVFTGVVHLAATLALLLTGHSPHVPLSESGQALLHPWNPAWLYRELHPRPLPWLTNLLAGLLTVAVVAVVYKLWRRFHHPAGEGLATRAQLRLGLGRSTQLGRAHLSRPSLAGVPPRQRDATSSLMRLGVAACGVGLWAQHEDSMIVVAPPRMGKTMFVAAGLVLDAPGPVAATSTKADLLSVTAGMRQQHGQVLVWDPEGISTWPHRLRWSPVTGCEDSQEAARRAAALVAGVSMGQVRGAGFFAHTAETVLRCLLHAAALKPGGTIADVVGWVANPADQEPFELLGRSPSVPQWRRDLDTFTRSAAKETNDSTRMTVALALDSLASPQVLQACSPAAGEAFDVEKFLVSRDTLYLLSAAEGQSTAPLTTAFVDFLTQAAKRRSQLCPQGRLDPPLRLVLDEAPNIAPLPGLAGLMADSGGRGITTIVFTQSFSQLRARWDKDKAGAIWATATIKLVLGGLAEADDLDHLSRLCGDRDVATRSVTSSERGGVSSSSATRRDRVMPANKIHELEVGTGLLLYRQLPPTLVRLTPWWQRSDLAQIAAEKQRVETLPLAIPSPASPMEVGS